MVCTGGLVVTCASDRALETAVAAGRGLLAFYGATPAYRAVLEVEGWGDRYTELTGSPGGSIGRR